MSVNPVVSTLLWSGLAVVFGGGIGYAAHRSPGFCQVFASFCNLPPTGFGFWSVGVCAVLLLFGLIDLLRATVSAMRSKEVAPIERVRFVCAGWQTIVGGSLLLVLLFGGFVSVVSPAAKGN